MNDDVDSLLQVISNSLSLESADRREASRQLDWLSSASSDDVRRLLEGLAESDAVEEPESGEILAAVLRELLKRGQSGVREFDDQSRLQALARLYRRMGPKSDQRASMLQRLALEPHALALRTLAELLAEDPPFDSQGVVLALSPLVQNAKAPVESLFPALLEGMQHPQAASAVLDLANYVTRKKRVARHPASEHADAFARLLRDVVQRLAQLEEDPTAVSMDAQQLSRTVSEGVALAVSLCDALALIGDRSVVGKIYPALELGHRRVRAEAAAALATLGETRGEEALIELAAEPVARLRVLAYADELGLSDRIEPRFRTAEARAEAELVLWLADPLRFGIPPTSCDLFDHREMYWPGYEEIVECFLFRFAYDLGDAAYSNIGVAGPLSFAFPADLADLPPGDIYAAYAGWQAEHDEIFELDPNRLDARRLADASRFERRLRDEQYESIRPVLFGVFFDETALVAEAVRNGNAGIAVVDRDDVFWRRCGNASRPLGAAEIYSMYKGRRLLKAFNQDEP